MKNINCIKEANLCISCGVCAANCPKNCISYKLNNGMYLPEISNECIMCGKCAKVCPSINMEYEADNNEIENYVLGDYKSIICAKSRDLDLRKNSTSGGVVTQIVTELLKSGMYESAFLVDGYDYHKQVFTKRFAHGDDLTQSAGSRYLTVSHTEAVRYMLEHPDEKAIIVATGCAVDAILKTVNVNKLNRDNYLIIGLFCDKTMHYGVIEYFDKHKDNNGKTVNNLYFRTKKDGKWPGNVRITYTDGSETALPSSARKNLKEYFVPERCLYCLDKLNKMADISVGDNYIKKNADEFGVSSVIIRTNIGETAWNLCADKFDYHDDNLDEFLKSQLVTARSMNIYFGKLKGIYQVHEPASKQNVKAFNEIKRKMKIGTLSNNLYVAVTKDINRINKINKAKRLFSKIFK